MHTALRYTGLLLLAALLTGSIVAPIAHAVDHFLDVQATTASFPECPGADAEHFAPADSHKPTHPCVLCSSVAFASWMAQEAQPETISGKARVIPPVLEPDLLFASSSNSRAPPAG